MHDFLTALQIVLTFLGGAIGYALSFKKSNHDIMADDNDRLMKEIARKDKENAELRKKIEELENESERDKSKRDN